jgi:hypothetical protein
MTSNRLFKLIYDLSNEDYHTQDGSYSSSQLKEAYNSIDKFYQLYITKTLEKGHVPAFDVGTYFHTAILEPERLGLDTAIFQHSTGRRGEAWKLFQEKHKGKTIITESEYANVSKIIEAVKNSTSAQSILKNTKPEVSCYIRLYVTDKEIICPDKKVRLTSKGWEKHKVPKELDPGLTFTLKVRADAKKENVVADLKSSSGNVKDYQTVLGKIKGLDYDLSAALYKDIFDLVCGESNEFYWIFASKEDFGTRSYVATQGLINEGRAKYIQALYKIFYGIKSNWQFSEKIIYIGPETTGVEEKQLTTESEDEI